MIENVASHLRPGLAVAALLAVAAAIPDPVSAQDNNAWMRFNGRPVDAVASQSFDRSFVREWEANPPRGYPTLSKSNIAATKAAITHYTDVVKRGGWRSMPEVELQLGSSHDAVAILHERLSLSGDLKGDSGPSEYFDGTLERAVKRFQASNGLTPTGIVDKRTIAALNVSAQARLKQLKTNLGRLAALVATAGRKYVVVNIPAQQIEAVEGDRVVSRHAGVVGKFDRPTPVLRSSVHELNFNPVWRLPPTVINKDLIPKGREMSRGKVDVLTKFHIDAYDGAGRKLDPKKVNWNSGQPLGLSYRQQPGPDNPLGFVKINFHNAHSVYLHDTPSDRLFGRNFRAASSGCVRVQDVESLAAWLLADNGDWSRGRVIGLKESRERLDVKVKKPVPLHMVYITAWATEDGVVQFRRDLYRRDGVDVTASTY